MLFDFSYDNLYKIIANHTKSDLYAQINIILTSWHCCNATQGHQNSITAEEKA